MLVRMAEAYRGGRGLAGYDHHVIVGVTLRNPTPAGFPSAAEGDDLERFELNLCQALEAEEESLCVLVVTNQGIRDLIFYTSNPGGATQRLESAAPTLMPYAYEVAIEPDAQWEIYQAFDSMFAPPPKPN